MRLRRNYFSDCNQIRRVRGALSQQPTHRLLLYRVRHVSGEVRRFENTAHLTSTFYRGGVVGRGERPASVWNLASGIAVLNPRQWNPSRSAKSLNQRPSGE